MSWNRLNPSHGVTIGVNGTGNNLSKVTPVIIYRRCRLRWATAYCRCHRHCVICNLEMRCAPLSFAKATRGNLLILAPKPLLSYLQGVFRLVSMLTVLCRLSRTLQGFTSIGSPSTCTKNFFLCTLFNTVSEDAGIEPRTNATVALAVRRFNHSARSHQQTRLDLIHKSARSHPHSARSHPQLG